MEFRLFTLIFILCLFLTDCLDYTRKSTGLCCQIILIDKNRKYRMPIMYSQNIYALHSVGTFVFSRIYLFLPLEMHSFSCEWNQPQSFCYIRRLKRICIISSVSCISFHNDMLHWSALKVFTTHLILIRLLILLKFQQTVLIVSVLKLLTNDLICRKENIIKGNQISSFSCSRKKIMLT